MVEFLTSPAITGILAFILVIGVYAFTHTGSPTSILMVVLSLGLLLGARYLTGLALWWEILVLAVGVLLILLEVFVLPGFGVAGIIGIVMVLVGLLLTLVPHMPGEIPLPKGNLGWSVFKQTLLAVSIAFIAATIAGYYLMRNLPKMPIGRRLALAAPEAVNAPPVADVSLYEGIKPGSEGVLEATCRPIGTVRIGGELFDAMSEGDMIERGQRVRVLRREGNTLVVERSPEPS
jgi:membrane-bound serine protease (ClpP class)